MNDALNLKEIGERVRILRQSQGLSQFELGQASGLSRQHIHDIESGKRGLSADSLYRLSRVLLVSADYILSGRGMWEGQYEVLGELLRNFEEEDIGHVDSVLRTLLMMKNESKKKALYLSKNRSED